MGGAHWRVPDIRSRRRFYPACGGHGGAYGRLVGIAARVVWGPSLVPLGREASKSPSRAAPLPKQRLRAAAYRHSPGCTPGVRPTRSARAAAAGLHREARKVVMPPLRTVDPGIAGFKHDARPEMVAGRRQSERSR